MNAGPSTTRGGVGGLAGGNQRTLQANASITPERATLTMQAVATPVVL